MITAALMLAAALLGSTTTLIVTGRFRRRRDLLSPRAGGVSAWQLATMVQQSSDAIILKSLTGEILEWNQGAQRLYGYSAEEMIGRPISILVPADRQDEMGSLIARAVRGQSSSVETKRMRKDGMLVEVSLAVTPIQSPSGEVVAISWIARDITARKRAEARLLEAERRFRGLLESAPDAMVIATEDGEIALVNRQAEMLFGYSREEMVGQPIEMLIPERSRAGHVARRRRFTSDPRPRPMGVGVELAARRKDGSELPVEVSLSPMRTPDGLLISSAIRDVSDSRAAQQALQSAEERFRRAFDEAPIGMALVDLDGRIEQANTALGVVCERPRSELEGVALAELVHPGDHEQTKTMLSALTTGRTESAEAELRFMPAAGAAVDVSAHTAVVTDSSGHVAGILCQFLNVTERKQFETQLQFMADHDPLTGLPNRRKFEQQLDKHVSQVKRYGPEGALLVLDIDHFKQVNDTLGHHAGDQLIISVAGALRERLRESDILARLGGDEFALLLPKANRSEAEEVATALGLAVRTRASLLNGEHRKVTTSIGITQFDTDLENLTAETALIEANLAMYDAKDAGRDRYSFYVTSGYGVSRTKARLTWASRIERALENDQFTLAAQPILDLGSGQITQHELLIRMLDERNEQIPPATFLYIAERFGLIAQLDEWVTSRAIELIELRPELQLEVNISGRSLGDQRLLGAIDARLRSARIDPAQLIFEVTETAAVANIAQAQAFARQLRDLGCRFALDDFGAGFGSFYYLKHLPFDDVKIDGEFVQHALTGHVDQLVIKAVVEIAQGLGKKTIAEFVTDEKTCRIVKRLGVDYAQGNHIGEPVSVGDLVNPSRPKEAVRVQVSR